MEAAIPSRWRCVRPLAIFAFVAAAGRVANAFPDDAIVDRVFADAFDPPPAANFGAVAHGLAVTFSDQSSDGTGTIATWAWDFGDGTTSAEQNPVHAFAVPSTYTVAEMVVDSTNGEFGAVSKSVTVAPCGVLTSHLHDFIASGAPGGHPDFEAFDNGIATGLVYSTITPGGIPSLKSTKGSLTIDSISSAESFSQWFVDDPINFPITQTLALTEGPPGTFSYSSNAYFPLDGAGFGDLAGTMHNYDFTTMLHAEFQYNGGENFIFIGDDDVWVYINGKLAIDLGGVHGATTGSITLDPAHAVALGLTVGQTYNFDLFQAQRHTTASDFNLQTSACLSDAP